MNIEKRHVNGTTYYRARYGATPGKWYAFQGFCGEWNQTNEEGWPITA